MNKKVELTKIFNIISPIMDDRKNFEFSEKYKNGWKPFLGRSSLNNGITGFANKRLGYLNKGNTLTIALDGSTGSTFYQKDDFYCGQNIWLLEPINFKLDEKLGMFFATLISKTVNDYSYNLSLTKNRLSKIKINLPFKNGEIDLNEINEINERIVKFNPEIVKFNYDNIEKINKLKKIKIVNIFNDAERIKSGVPIYKVQKIKTKYKTKENNIAFISSAMKNHYLGIVGWLNASHIQNAKKIYKGNYILINNNGSIGYTRFFNGEFIGTSDVTILKPLDSYGVFLENEKIIIYIVANIQKYLAFMERNYNIKLKNDEINNIEILMPVDEVGAPDFKKLLDLI